MNGSRRGQRGAATVEMVVVMPVFLVLMAVSFWTTQLYEQKIAAGKAVRGPVFTQATFGCGAPGTTSFEPSDDEPTDLESHNGSEPLDRVEGADLEVVGRKLPGAPGGDLVKREIGDRTAGKVSPIVSNGLVAARTKVSAHVSMTCNESVRDGDSKAMKKTSTSTFDPRSP